MTTVKRAASITAGKLLVILAALAGMMAVSIQNISCFLWFHQPETPACLLDNDE